VRPVFENKRSSSSPCAARGSGGEYCSRLAALGAAVMRGTSMMRTRTVEQRFKRRAAGLSRGDSRALHRLWRSIESRPCRGRERLGRVETGQQSQQYGARGADALTPTEKEWDAAMAVNVRGIWNCARPLSPRAREGQGAAASSKIAIDGGDLWAPYALTLHHLKGRGQSVSRGVPRPRGLRPRGTESILSRQRSAHGRDP